MIRLGKTAILPRMALRACAGVHCRRIGVALIDLVSSGLSEHKEKHRLRFRWGIAMATSLRCPDAASRRDTRAGGYTSRFSSTRRFMHFIPTPARNAIQHTVCHNDVGWPELTARSEAGAESCAGNAFAVFAGTDHAAHSSSIGDVEASPAPARNLEPAAHYTDASFGQAHAGTSGQHEDARAFSTRAQPVFRERHDP